MFESQTYDTIMDRVMDKMPENVAKDEGSFLYTAAGPVGIEHEQMYAALDNMITQSFAMTASLDNLKIMAAAVGMEPHEATPAVWSAVVAPALMSTRVGARFNCGDMNLVVTGRKSEGIWELTCETPGAAGNTLSSELVPITFVSGLESITLYQLETAGSDAETEEEFRERYLFYLRKPAATGNVYNYIEWALSVDGVGAAKVFPTWNGGGTVKVVITSSDKKAAPSALINTVQAHIEEERPVGATVTVISGVELPINVSAAITMKPGYILQTIQGNFKAALTEYLEDNAFEIDYLPIARVGSILLGTEGVADYSNLRVNDGIENIDLSAEQIAVIGAVALEVASE